MAGGFRNCDSPTDNGACVAPNITSGVLAYAGYCLYDADTCGLTSATTEASATSSPGPTCDTLTPGAPGATGCTPFAPFTVRTDFTLTSTPTQNTWHYNAGCTLYPGFFYRKLFGEDVTATLSIEDTDDDAIARLLAGAGGIWSSWTPVGDGTGGTCINYVCCLARYEERTTGFTFTYQESQYRVEKTGLIPSTLYYAHVEIWRRPFGSGSYVSFETLVVSGTTDGSGNLLIEGDVPNDIGFETYAQSASIVIPI